MFLTSKTYFTATKNLVSDNQKIDIAVAFWGKGASDLISDPGKKFRVICNLNSGGTNPSVISSMLENKNLKIRTLDKLHAKVIISENKAIVGSANFSSNGLNLEGDLVHQGWEEAGIEVKNKIAVAEIQVWFDELWKSSKPITPSMLENAHIAWDARTPYRPVSTSKLLDMNPSDLSNRNLVVGVWQENLSQDGESKLQEVNAANSAINKENMFDIYEDWLDLLDEGQDVLDIRIGPEGGVSLDGVKKVVAKEKSPDGSKSFHTLVKLDRIFNGIKTKDAIRGIEQQIRKNPKKVWNASGGKGAYVMKIEEFIPFIRSL